MEREREALRGLLGDGSADVVEALQVVGLPVPPAPAFVTAVLVAHDGARWLPGCLAALASQTRPPDELVAVDTGSTDDGPALLAAAVPHVLQRPRDSGFGAAVAAGVAAAPGPPATTDAPQDWIWLLHDDCAPAPTALEELLRAAGTTAGAGVLGPKVVDWDDPRLLVDVGLTVDRAGRRVTSLEAAELDQGQHDAARDVLAVGSAGALVRRATWDRLAGTDPALPLFRDDVDLCWRAGLAGERVVVVPAAVVRHARAVATGRRPADAVTGSPRCVDREHGLHVLLANAGPLGLLLGLPRVALGGLVRALAYLLTRRPHLARDESAAVGRLLLHLPRLLRSRRWRRGQRTERPSVIGPLLQPRGARLRAGAGAATDWLASGGSGTPAAPAGPAPGALETGPVEEEEELLPTPDVGRRRRALTRPGLVLPLALALLTLVAARQLTGGGVLVGGRLLPPSLSASDLWSSWAATWVPGPDGGSPSAAAPWTPWLALLAGATLGRVSLAVDIVLLGAVPLAGFAAWRATRHTAASPSLRLWGAAAYALTPVVTGSVAGGRFDTAVAVIAVPGLLAAGHRLLTADPERGGWRRAWTLGLGLSVAAAFAPPLWALAAVLLVGGAAVALLTGAPLRRAATALLPLLVPPVLALPWLPRLLADPGVLLTGLGRPGGVAGLDGGATPTGVDLLLLRPAATGLGGLPPAWVVLPLLGVALTALLRSDQRRRRAALALWAVALTGLVGAVVASRQLLPTAGGTPQTGWPGPAVAVAAAALVGASMIGAEDLGRRLARRSFGVPQVAAILLVAVALPVPLALGVLWAARGAQDPLVRRDVALLPLDVLADAVAVDPRQRLLVLAQDSAAAGGVRYDLRGLAGLRLGEEEVVPSPPAVALLDTLVADLATARGTDAAETLATFHVSIVAVPGAARTPLTDALDAQPALSRRATRSADVSVWLTTVPTGRLQVLDPDLSGAALAPAAATEGTGRGPGRAALAAEPPLVLPPTDEGASLRLPAGPEGRLLVLSEAADAGWSASVGGRPLEPVTAWAWAQAFRLPAGGGDLELTRESRRRHLLLVGQALALALVLVLAAPSLGRDRTTLDDAAPSP